jgi:hypothetical protein
MFDRSGCNQGAAKADPVLSTDSTRTFRHSAIDRDLSEWSKECADQAGGGVAGEQLGPGHDRIVHSVTTRRQLPSTAQVVDETSVSTRMSDTIPFVPTRCRGVGRRAKGRRQRQLRIGCLALEIRVERLPDDFRHGHAFRLGGGVEANATALLENQPSQAPTELARLVEAMSDMWIGPLADPTSDMAPTRENPSGRGLSVRDRRPRDVRCVSPDPRHRATVRHHAERHGRPFEEYLVAIIPISGIHNGTRRAVAS